MQLINEHAVPLLSDLEKDGDQRDIRRFALFGEPSPSRETCS